MDERDEGIHISVVIQEAAKVIAANPNISFTEIADEMWLWRQDCVSKLQTAQKAPPAQRQSQPPYREEPPPPEPPDEWPEDESGFQSAPAVPTCKCGHYPMEYQTGEGPNGAWAAYFCPQKKRSKDPRVQAEQKQIHPPVWV